MSGILLISPLSDRYNGVGNFGAPCLGVWRLKGNLETRGVRCDVWDCNVGFDVPPEIVQPDGSIRVEDLVVAFAQNIEKSFDTDSYDWIGFSILNDTLPLTLGLANYLKQKHPMVKQVAGNAEATLNYQDILDKTKIDCCLIGEPDLSIHKLVLGQDPREIEGCVWRSWAKRQSPEEFYGTFKPVDFSKIPYREYWKRTSELYKPKTATRSFWPFVEHWLDRGWVDYTLASEGMSEKESVQKLREICCVRIVTMDHCFLPCTYCLPHGLILTKDRGKQDISEIVSRNEGTLVIQADGTFGEVSRVYERQYDGEIVILETRGGERLDITPNHHVHVLGLDKKPTQKPAGQVSLSDSLLVVGSEGLEFKRVSAVGSYRYVGKVYNLEVKPTHTYTVNGIAVDNCSTARIPDRATGEFQRSVFLPIKACGDLLKQIKDQVPGVLSIYDDSDETFLGEKRGLEYADMLMSIREHMDHGLPWRFRYLVQTRSNEMSRRLVQKLSEAGVAHLTFGVENGSEHVRKSLRKMQDHQQMLDLIDWCNEFDIVCYYLLILFPPETRLEDVRRNVEVMGEWVRRGAVVSAEPYLMPYRGTPILDDPTYHYQHVTYDVPFSGTIKKKLKWPVLVWPKDPSVRGIMVFYRETIDPAIEKAKEAVGHNHTFKGFTGKVCVEHLKFCLELFDKGVVKPLEGFSCDEGEIHAVYQDYADQASGVEIRDEFRKTMQAKNGRFNPNGSSFMPKDIVKTTLEDYTTSGLKQGGVKSRLQKDPAMPDEPIVPNTGSGAAC